MRAIIRQLHCFVHLVEHRVVALPDASPLGLPGYRYLDDGLDVDAWQLAALDDPHTHLNPEDNYYDAEQIKTAKIRSLSSLLWFCDCKRVNSVLCFLCNTPKSPQGVTVSLSPDPAALCT